MQAGWTHVPKMPIYLSKVPLLRLAQILCEGTSLSPRLPARGID